MQNFFSGGGVIVARSIGLCWLLLALLAGGHPAWSQVISSFAPASGPIGTSVTITGSGFSATAAQNVVFFGATRAAVTAASPTSLTVTVPLGATYQYLTVTNLTTNLTAYANKPFGVTLVGAATFQPKVDAATGTTPLMVATGDVTGDGKADVVTVNYDDNTVSVLRNTSTPGAVSFAPKVDYSTGQLPIAVAIGDLDGDGKPDLAVTNAGSAFVSVFRNTSTAGAVGFAPGVNVGIGTRAGSLAIGDVDGDGKPDLIVADFGNSLVLVLRNTSTPGAVSFVSSVYFVAGTDSYGAYAVAVGDVDGDGLPDLAVTNYSINTVSVFRNTSTPGAVSFAAKVDLGYGTNPYSVVLGDLDGDGLPDLTMTSNTSVAVFRNTSVAGTVSFAAGVDFTTGQRPYAVHMGDVDGDGLPDLAAAIWGVNAVWVLRNTSVPGTISLVAQAIVTTGTRPRSVAIGDMDGDGKPDLTTGNEASSTVSVLRQTVRLTGLFLSPGTLSPAFDTGTLTYTASVDNATSSLLVVPSIDNPAASALVNGTAVVSGTYSTPIALAVGSNPITVALDGLTYTVTVTRDPNPPALLSLSPPAGPVGSSVTITGSDLTGATAVTFGGSSNNVVTTGLTVSGTGSNQTLTVPVPPGAITGFLTVTTTNGTSDGLFFTVIEDLTISTGTLAAPVAVAAGTYGTITVTSTGVGLLNGAVVANNGVVVNGTLLTNCQPLTGAGSFTLAAGATLGICDVNGITASGSTGAVQVSGTRSFSPDATYRYNGSVAQVTGNALPATVRELALANATGLTLSQAVSIRQRVQLASGNLTLNGRALTLRSDASGTALVDNSGGLVLGNTATLQRHIETNTASGGYRHYASPMQAIAGAETLATLATAGYTPNFSGAAAYNSSATPGLVTPFPTVFLYNQDRIATTTSTYDTFGKGWQAALGTEVPQVGRGYSVQTPGAALVDFTGTFTSGSVSRSNLQRASADPNTGWHLLGNPFPSPLDWSTMTLGAGQNLEGVDGAVYVYQSSGPYTGQYRTYLTAVPGGNSPIIPAGSGFFVHTTSPTTAGMVRFTGTNRVTEFGAQPAFGRSSNTRPVLTLALAGTSTDAVTLYLDPAATAGVDVAYDATKLTNPSGLNLAVLNGGTPLAIDGRPQPTATTVLPLALAVPAAGSYVLRVDELTNFAALPVYLRDARAGTEQLLTPGYTVRVTLAAGNTTRFSLVLRPAGALATAGPALAAQASIYPNPAHAAFTLTLPPVVSATQATAMLVNALGQVVDTRTLDLSAGGATMAYSTAGLAAGVYALRLRAGAEMATLRVVVE